MQVQRAESVLHRESAIVTQELHRRDVLRALQEHYSGLHGILPGRCTPGGLLSLGDWRSAIPVSTIRKKAVQIDTNMQPPRRFAKSHTTLPVWRTSTRGTLPDVLIPSNPIRSPLLATSPSASINLTSERHPQFHFKHTIKGKLEKSSSTPGTPRSNQISSCDSPSADPERQVRKSNSGTIAAAEVCVRSHATLASDTPNVLLRPETLQPNNEARSIPSAGFLQPELPLDKSASMGKATAGGEESRTEAWLAKAEEEHISSTLAVTTCARTATLEDSGSCQRRSGCGDAASGTAIFETELPNCPAACNNVDKKQREAISAHRGPDIASQAVRPVVPEGPPALSHGVFSSAEYGSNTQSTVHDVRDDADASQRSGTCREAEQPNTLPPDTFTSCHLSSSSSYAVGEDVFEAPVHRRNPSTQVLAVLLSSFSTPEQPRQRRWSKEDETSEGDHHWGGVDRAMSIAADSGTHLAKEVGQVRRVEAEAANFHERERFKACNYYSTALFDFREGVTKRVAKPDNRVIDKATMTLELAEVAHASKALLLHNQHRLHEETLRQAGTLECMQRVPMPSSLRRPASAVITRTHATSPPSRQRPQTAVCRSKRPEEPCKPLKPRWCYSRNKTRTEGHVPMAADVMTARSCRPLSATAVVCAKLHEAANKGAQSTVHRLQAN